MSEVKLSLVMIVKNEEMGLEKCLRSAQPFVDEIVICIDDSTTDKSVEIAKRFTKLVTFFKWEDNFAKARNDAAKFAQGEWILFLDGHEYIKECEGLAEKLARPVEGLMCVIQMENGMRFNNPRIYKRGVRFVGAVHEKQQCQTLEFFPKFVIQHDRLEGQDPAAAKLRKTQRDEMTPRIMLAELKKNPRNSRALFHLGMHAHGIGQNSQAFSWFRKYLKVSDNKAERWFVFFQMSTICLSAHKMWSAYWYAICAERETPGRWEIQKLLGLLWFEYKNYPKAIECFRASGKLNKVEVAYEPWPVDRAGTANIIGECFFRLSNFVGAELAFLAAAEKTVHENLRKLYIDRAALMRDLTASRKSGKI